ncbi:MAG: aminotransferase class III-fold pyridoxal phosphate-dependent enzyme [Anaerovoracaceae bacterium]|jgi:adenosylmethionine-8-amino-7-oxononanoate aminotransferase|nr:aminotransferase class III-fold pyridoxal phosphate-dependent enzyme [Anaerovoracaceae bacterium]
MGSNYIFPKNGENIPRAQKGQGVYVYDHKGKKYLDASSGPMAVNLGHGNKDVIQAISKQMDNISFTYRSQFTNQPLEVLCEKIETVAPQGLNNISFCSSGSEATELALKMAHSYWRAQGKPSKIKVISRWHSYHGATLGALSMSGNPARRKEYAAYLNDYPNLELPYCFRCPYEKAYPECNLFCARYFEKLVNQMGEDTISAFIGEPITGASGAGINPPQGYFETIERICRDKDILFIMDEVITGFGRTGKYFASQHYDIAPDIITFGKGISSGYGPLAGIIVRDSIYQGMKAKGGEFTTGHTFGGNPLSTAAGVATMEVLAQEDLVAGVVTKGEFLEEKLMDVLDRVNIAINLRGKGLLWGMEFARSKEDRTPFSKGVNLTNRIVETCFSNGLIVYPSSGFIDGVLGDSILISPPFIINKEEMIELASLLGKSLLDIEKELSSTLAI